MHNQVIVAHHEAAHAVIGYAAGAGASLCDITLEAEELNSTLEWTGHVPVSYNGLPEDSIAKIGIAGTLAEIKMSIVSESELTPETYRTDELARVKICPESVPAIATALWNLKTQNPPERCLYAEVDLDPNVPDGQRKHVTAFLGESSCDMVHVSKVVYSLEDLEQLVAATRELIDEPRIWQAVLSLARKLLEQKKRQVWRKTLTSRMVQGIIRHALDEPTK